MLHERTPLFVREGVGEPWRRWFAWRPVRLEQGGWIWLRYTHRRKFWPAPWFSGFSWNQYSDTKQQFWETVS